MTDEEGMAFLRRKQEESPPIRRAEPVPVSKAIGTLAEQRLFQSDPEREHRLAEIARREREREHESRIRRLLGESSLPQRHLRNRSRLKEANIWQEVLARLPQPGTGFILAFIGPRGTGKTQMAVELICAACSDYQSAKYVKALDLFRLLRSSFREDGPDEVALVKQFIGYQLLVIDEAHERGHSEFESRTLANIVDSRYDRIHDTVLLSNESLAQFAAAVGPSIASRINETGEVIEFDWPSYREQGGQDYAKDQT